MASPLSFQQLPATASSPYGGLSPLLPKLGFFEEKALAGEWEEVERYLSSFTKVDDNRYSMKIFFDIKKQKHLEVLDRAKAVEISVKDLKVFLTLNEELYKKISRLLTLENFSHCQDPLLISKLTLHS